MPHDLVDEYRLLVYPLVLGHGKRLFNETSKMNLKLAESKAFGSGVVKLVYHRASKPAPAAVPAQKLTTKAVPALAQAPHLSSAD